MTGHSVSLHQPPEPNPLVNDWDIILLANLHRMPGAARECFVQIVVENAKGSGFDVVRANRLNRIAEDVSRFDRVAIFVAGHKLVNQLTHFFIAFGLIDHLRFRDDVYVVQRNGVVGLVFHLSMPEIGGNDLQTLIIHRVDAIGKELVGTACIPAPEGHLHSLGSQQFPQSKQFFLVLFLHNPLALQQDNRILKIIPLYKLC